MRIERSDRRVKDKRKEGALQSSIYSWVFLSDDRNKEMMSCFSIVTVRNQCWLVFFSAFLFVVASVVASPSTSSSGIEVGDTTIHMLSEDSLRDTIKDVTNLLEKGKKMPGDTDGDDSTLASATTNLDQINQTMEEITESMKRLQALTEKMLKKESKVNSLLKEANTRELDYLVERLLDTLESETDLRELEQEIQSERNTLAVYDNDDDDDNDDLSAINDNINKVTSNTLHERLDTNVIMEESEAKMRKWILSLIEEELVAYRKNILDAVPVDIGSGDYNFNSDTNDDDDTTTKVKTNNKCPSTTSIVQKVQQSLQDYADDGIGRVDYAQGANVVHWMTSETYSPVNNGNGKILGSVWWSKFIPQDWERLLPSDWEEWNVGIPSYVYHSLGFMSGDIAPPEALIQKNTLPGSCWPMEGSTGQVTLKLSYPVVVESVSIDHISQDIIPEGKYESAPKHMKIIGYPPCSDDDSSNCAAIGFDINNPIDIAEIRYEVDGPSIQSFDSYYTKAIDSMPPPLPPATTTFNDDDDDDEEVEEVDSGSCSVQTASCSGPPRISVAAVTMKVLENWGNPDLTCLYRLRLHGDPDFI